MTTYRCPVCRGGPARSHYYGCPSDNVAPLTEAEIARDRPDLLRLADALTRGAEAAALPRPADPVIRVPGRKPDWAHERARADWEDDQRTARED